MYNESFIMIEFSEINDVSIECINCEVFNSIFIFCRQIKIYYRVRILNYLPHDKLLFGH